MTQFETIYQRLHKEEKVRILGIDPGGTVGWSVMIGSELTDNGQCPGYEHKTGEIQWESVEHLLESTNPQIVVCEDYRIYESKLKEHTFSSVPTLRIIGMIEYWCYKNGIPIYYQMAQQAKGFTTDEKLKKWLLWQKGQKHSRDSIRHLCYFIIFNKELLKLTNK